MSEHPHYQVPEISHRWRTSLLLMIGCTVMMILGLFLPFVHSEKLSFIAALLEIIAAEWQKYRWKILLAVSIPISFGLMLILSIWAYNPKRASLACWNIVFSTFDAGFLGLIVLDASIYNVAIGLWLMLSSCVMMMLISWRFMRHLKQRW